MFFLLPTKERTKENCRCCDAADPRLKGYSPLRIPNRKSEDSAAKRTQYYCPFLTPPNLPPLLSRGFPRTPAGVRGGPLVKGGCHRKVTGGFRRALPWLPWLVRAAALPCPSRFDCASIGRPVLWPPRIQFAFGCRGAASSTPRAVCRYRRLTLFGRRAGCPHPAAISPLSPFK